MWQSVLDFWFKDIDAAKWWAKDKAFDKQIKTTFGTLLQQASVGELAHWRKSAEGSLAEIIVLDQFSRNIHRDTPAAFASDPMALVLSQVAIEKKFDLALPPIQRSFMYMPYMHSESRVIHVEAVNLFTMLGMDHSLDFEMKHKAIIDQFGRYPHRNSILGRESTEDELAFLSLPNSSF